MLVALVSWGEGCADPDFPAVNTRISALLDFIDASVCEHLEHPPPEFHCPGTEPPPLPKSSHTTILFAPLFVVAAIFYFCRPLAASTQKPESQVQVEWLPNEKPGLDRRGSSETEPLYQSSPASSKGSNGYRTTESMDV